MSLARLAVFAVASSCVGAALFAVACSKPEEKQAQAAEPAKCPTCVVADGRGFTPSKVTLAKGGPGSKGTVTFTRTSDETCAKEVVVPELKIKEDLPLNRPVTLQIPTDDAKTLTFQCGMGMYKSSIVVN